MRGGGDHMFDLYDDPDDMREFHAEMRERALLDGADDEMDDADREHPALSCDHPGRTGSY